jgi:4-amino-4-deoxy-L-arabinose transferase-like glycosyltransferase
MLGAIAVVALWYVPARMAGADNAAEAMETGIGANLFRNTIGRALLGVSKAQPPWYYLKTLPVDMLPWTFLCPPLLLWIWRNRYASLGMRATWCWVVPAIVLFSIIIGKRELYLMPVIPGIAILFAAALVGLLETGKTIWIRRGVILWSGLLVLFILAPLAVPYVPYSLPSVVPVYVFAGIAGATGAVGLLVALRGHIAHLPVVVATQAVVLFAATALVVFPVINHFKSAREICAPVRALAATGQPMTVYSAGFSREEYVYYAEHFHEPVFTGLLGDIAPEELWEQAVLQKKAQRLIQKAVRDVPLSSLQSPSMEERQALLRAIDEKVAEDEAMEAIVHFEEVLRIAVNEFFGAFDSDRPVFCFVQEEDWRWLLAFLDGEQPARILAEQGVGSRHVLLLANDVAVSALSPPSPE